MQCVFELFFCCLGVASLHFSAENFRKNKRGKKPNQKSRTSNPSGAGKRSFLGVR